MLSKSQIAVIVSAQVIALLSQAIKLSKILAVVGVVIVVVVGEFWI